LPSFEEVTYMEKGSHSEDTTGTKATKRLRQFDGTADTKYRFK